MLLFFFKLIKIMCTIYVPNVKKCKIIFNKLLKNKILHYFNLTQQNLKIIK